MRADRKVPLSKEAQAWLIAMEKHAEKPKRKRKYRSLKRKTLDKTEKPHPNNP